MLKLILLLSSNESDIIIHKRDSILEKLLKEDE